MEFDKSRVYTVLNADELKVGSTVFVADTLAYLKEVVNDERSDRRVKLDRIASECCDSRFHADSENWLLAYLISPPKEPKYKPFSDTETAYKTITAHGGWIKTVTGEYLMITGIDIGHRPNKAILVGRHWYSAQAAFDTCIFADDGSLVGEKVEDDDNNA